MAEDCKQSTEILKQAYAKGLPVPKYHYEQRTCTVVKYVHSWLGLLTVLSLVPVSVKEETKTPSRL